MSGLSQTIGKVIKQRDSAEHEFNEMNEVLAWASENVVWTKAELVFILTPHQPSTKPCSVRTVNPEVKSDSVRANYNIVLVVHVGILGG